MTPADVQHLGEQLARVTRSIESTRSLLGRCELALSHATARLSDLCNLVEVIKRESEERRSE